MTSARLLLALSIVALTSILQSQTSQIAVAEVPVPRMVRYSGTLKIDKDTSAARVAGVTFALYREQDGGAPLFIETQSVNLDAQGHYSVQLGSTKTEGLPTALFNTGEARWLGVQVSGQPEQPRVLLLSVPYALKAADAETIGGLPPSAFMLAAPAAAGNEAETTDTASRPTSAPPPVSGTGTADFVPLWLNGSGALGNSALFQSGSGSTAKLGVNTTTPLVTLDVKGAATIRGPFTLPATGPANASAGKNSEPQNFSTSSFNSGTSTSVNQQFRWQAEPAGNNTATASGSLNLLFGRGSAAPSETGLKIASSGRIAFAPGQTFPGTVKSVGLIAPSSDFTVSGSPITSNGTLNLDWNVNPTSSDIVNAIVKRDSNGNFSANAVGTNTLSANAISSGTADVSNSYGTANTVVITGQSFGAGAGPTYGVYGTSTTSQGAGVAGRSDNTTSGYGVLGSNNNTSPAVAGFNFNSVNGIGVLGAGAWGFYTNDSVHQGLGGGGWVKAMIVYDDVIQQKMLRCFNSTLAGAAATTVPCGFSTNFFSTGIYGVNFGFDVSNRFLSANASAVNGHYYVAGASPGAANSVIVNLLDVNSLSFQNGIFTVIVY